MFCSLNRRSKNWFNKRLGATIMILETERLKIVQCTEEMSVLAKAQNYSNGPQVDDYLADLKNDPTINGWGSWYVIRKEDDAVIGDIGFKGKPNLNKVVEVSYGLLAQYFNKGYATEAVEELIHWAFDTNQVNKIMAEVLKVNAASIGVLKKVGMKKLTEVNEMYYYQIKKA